ncbi:hypothetical protein A2U01_0047974, partial [Trifolium medium]|nr:hypothetical protein [Trifolium medium]
MVVDTPPPSGSPVQELPKLKPPDLLEPPYSDSVVTVPPLPEPPDARSPELQNLEAFRKKDGSHPHLTKLPPPKPPDKGPPVVSLLQSLVHAGEPSTVTKHEDKGKKGLEEVRAKWTI